MTDNIGSAELALVPSELFVQRMEQHWSQRLGMCCSEPLRALWRAMAITFSQTTCDTDHSLSPPWRILQPPTGSGKTQGTCVYAALQAALNSTSDKRPVGILIVTRLIEQADSLAAAINELADREVATAHHSQARKRAEELMPFDVLVVTHQAYVYASEGRSAGRHSGWTKLMAWRGGNRLLTIVDEALGNVIDNSTVTIDGMEEVLRYVTPAIWRQHPSQCAMLDLYRRMLTAYAHHAESVEGADFPAMKMVMSEAATDSFTMAPLAEALRKLPFDKLNQKDSEIERKKIAQRIEGVLEDVETMLKRPVYYSRKGVLHSFNSSAMLATADVPGPVVLDATARQTFLYDLLENRAVIVPTPSERVRDYCNVTLHLGRAQGLGKHAMRERFAQRFPRLLDSLERELGPERSLFLCTHKQSEPVALSYKTQFAKFSVGHWGAIDGRNDWADYDAAVIFGLSYRDNVWSTNAFFATQGVQDDDWLLRPRWKEHKDVRRVMQQRQLSVSIIQAINRVRCRRVTDSEGRSPSADIYLMLPADADGDAILRDILADMPGLKVLPWLFDMDGPRVRRVRAGSSHEALIAFMANRQPGEVPLAEVKRALGFDLKKQREVLRNPEHPTTQALKAIGVYYLVMGKGRGARAFLVKHEAPRGGELEELPGPLPDLAGLALAHSEAANRIDAAQPVAA